MNAQQKKFCEEYVKNGLNGKRAYLSSYKSCKKESTAEVNASKLLRNTKVQEYISQLQSELRSKAIMSATERMEFLSSVVSGELKESSLDGDKEVKMGDRLKAVEIMNKMDGSNTENINVNNPYAELTTEELRKLANGK